MSKICSSLRNRVNPFVVPAKQGERERNVLVAVQVETDPPGTRDVMVWRNYAAGNELIAERTWERQIGNVAAVEVAEFAFASGNEALRERRKSLDRLSVEKDAVPQMIAKIKTEIKSDRERLVKWEREMRRELISQTTVEALESLILSIDRAEILDV